MPSHGNIIHMRDDPSFRMFVKHISFSLSAGGVLHGRSLLKIRLSPPTVSKLQFCCFFLLPCRSTYTLLDGPPARKHEGPLAWATPQYRLHIQPPLIASHSSNCHESSLFSERICASLSAGIRRGPPYHQRSSRLCIHTYNHTPFPRTRK